MPRKLVAKRGAGDHGGQASGLAQDVVTLPFGTRLPEVQEVDSRCPRALPTAHGVD